MKRFILSILVMLVAWPLAAQPPIIVPKGTIHTAAHKLGALPANPLHLSKMLKLRNYLGAKLPAPPASIAWYSKVAGWPSSMWGNNSLSDCTVAGACSIILCQTSCNGVPNTIPLSTAESFYYALGNGGDNGLMLSTVLSAMQQQGLGGVTWGPFVSVDPTNVTECQQAIVLFGGLYIGINLPSAWDSNTTAWTVSGANTRSVGGHCVTVLGYDQSNWQIYTWSKMVPTQQAALGMVTTEAYALVNPSWYQPSGTAPSGLNVTQLVADAQAMGQLVGPLPTPTPTPPGPNPTPTPPTPTPTPPTPVPPVVVPPSIGPITIGGGTYSVSMTPGGWSQPTTIGRVTLPAASYTVVFQAAKKTQAAKAPARLQVAP